MRENNLLSPHRCRRRGGNPHDGEIITHAPNLMWGTDGVRVFTVDDGWGWIFTAVEHWNAECVGWHVCKRGDRFAALQPISMGLAGLYGSTAAGAARGLALRMDHGSQYLSDHFTNQIKFWGIPPSYAFVAEPQSPLARRLSIKAWTTTVFSVAPSTTARTCLSPLPSTPIAAIRTWSPTCRPSIWMTSRSSSERSEASQAFIFLRDSATKRRETADFEVPSPRAFARSALGQTDRAVVLAGRHVQHHQVERPLEQQVAIA